MKKIFLSVLALSFLTFAQGRYNSAPKKGLQKFVPISSKAGQLVNHQFYSLSYLENHEQPEWVGYLLSDKVLKNNVRRQNDFREDMAVKTGSAIPSDYKSSGYSRGHLVPSGDMKVSRLANSETFFMSNMSPQSSAFNSGIWNQLEMKVREWIKDKKAAYVFTGPVLSPNLPNLRDKKGKTNAVSIPDYYYKIIFKEDTSGKDKHQVIAFLMAHKNSRESLMDFVVSVDEIEKMTGLDFFSELPDNVEDRVEKSKDISDWKFSKSKGRSYYDRDYRDHNGKSKKSNKKDYRDNKYRNRR